MTSDTAFQQMNRELIKTEKGFTEDISQMKEVQKFLDDFGFLSDGRDYVFCGNQIFSLSLILNSAKLTVKNIIACCESGCMADAYTLLRKYRDDLFFYLYIVVYDGFNKCEPLFKSKSDMEANIKKWLENGLNDLHIGAVLFGIAQNPAVNEAVHKYNLKSCFEKLSSKLNDYVHGNGVGYYNKGIRAYEKGKLQSEIQSLQQNMRYITIMFLFLLTLCSPLSIMSQDYTDYLDNNLQPPQESQYWAAPFIKLFFEKNVSLIDKECLAYLGDHTVMDVGVS